MDSRANRTFKRLHKLNICGGGLHRRFIATRGDVMYHARLEGGVTEYYAIRAIGDVLTHYLPVLESAL